MNTILVIWFILYLIRVGTIYCFLLWSLYLVRINDGCLVGETVDGVSGSWVIDENIIIAVVYRLCWTFVVSKAVLSILSWALVVLGIQSCSKTGLVYCVSAVLNVILTAVVDHVLLILSVLDRNRRLLIMLLLSTVVGVDVALLFNVGIDSVSSRHGSSTWVLLELIFGWKTESCVAVWSLLALTQLLLLIHLAIQSLSLIENFHELVIHLIRIQLLEDVLLMFKLVLGLFLLLKSLLLLDSCVGILSSALFLVFGHLFEVLTMTLSSFIIVVILDGNSNRLLLLLGVHSWGKCLILSRISNMLIQGAKSVHHLRTGVVATSCYPWGRIWYLIMVSSLVGVCITTHTQALVLSNMHRQRLVW